jgi:hypothetical protein
MFVVNDFFCTSEVYFLVMHNMLAGDDDNISHKTKAWLF